MTVASAERAVGAFLERAAARDLRIVLVVTGKGIRLEGGRTFGGRIRGEFLGWLDRPDNRGRVRAVRPAHVEQALHSGEAGHQAAPARGEHEQDGDRSPRASAAGVHSRGAA